MLPFTRGQAGTFANRINWGLQENDYGLCQLGRENGISMRDERGKPILEAGAMVANLFFKQVESLARRKL